MLDSITSAPRTVAAATFGLFALSALVAVSYPTLPSRAVGECATGDATATCNGQTWEKLICDDPIKLTKCFDAKTTCSDWDVCDCCSPVPLHKCLSPLAGRSFDTDCSSPLDAREECCGDAATHIRSFKGLVQLTDDLAGALEAAQQEAAAAAAELQSLVDQGTEAGGDALKMAQAKADELKEIATALSAKMSGSEA